VLGLGVGFLAWEAFQAALGERTEAA